MDDWVEVADGVLVLRFSPRGIDVTTTAVVGPTGVVVVDSLDSPGAAAGARARLQERTGLPVVGLVHTHAHYDHTFGAVAWTGASTPDRPGDRVTGRAPVRTYAHHRLGEHLIHHEEPELAAGRAGDLVLGDPRAWDDVVLEPPDVSVTGTTTVSPGGRDLALHALPPAHTSCDLVVHVPDVDVWVVGDVVEESAEPSFEPDSDPRGWAMAVAGLAARMGPGALVVPGHGACVDRGFVEGQARTLGVLAAALEDCRRRGVGEQASIRELHEATGWHGGTLRAAARAFWSGARGPAAPA